jgi:hypothetical protein
MQGIDLAAAEYGRVSGVESAERDAVEPDQSAVRGEPEITVLALLDVEDSS